MRNRYLLFFVLLFSIHRASGQVQLQNGSATFSVPMFQWKDDKSNLFLSVGMNYNSGNGLRVNDIASNVGQGWNLISGGVISRMQVGEPDDQYPNNGNGTPEDIKKYPAGYLYAQNAAGLGCPENLKRYPLYRSQNQVYTQRNVVAEDKQLDYFYFQFNGKSGVFVIDTVGDDHGVALNDERIKITFQHNTNLSFSAGSIRTTIQSFTIQDVDGLLYKFSILGVSRVLNTKYCDQSFTHIKSQPKFKNNKVFYQSGFPEANAHKPWVVGSWYLSEIRDPFTNRVINLNYQTRVIQNQAGDEVTYMQGRKDYAVINRKKTHNYLPEIASITTPDGHTVDFVYGSDRLDYNGLKVLNSVDIKYNSRYVSKYHFNTSYFILRRYGTPQTAEQRKVSRLCLLGVKKYGVDLKEESQSYKFDYYLGSGAADDFVPPYFSSMKDNWGFHNGYKSRAYNTTYLFGLITISGNTPLDAAYLNANQAKGLCFLQEGNGDIYINPNDGYAKNGLLKQIILPSGGTVKYDYSQNKGVLNATTQSVGGVHVSAVSSTDGGYSNGCDNPLVTNYNFVLDAVGNPSSLWGLEKPLHSLRTISYYKPESRYYRYNLAQCGIFGCCEWRFKYPGIPSLDQAINLGTWMNILNVGSQVLSVVSAVLTVIDVITLITAPTPGIIVAVVLDIVVGLLDVALTCIGDQDKTYTTDIFYNSDIGSVSPMPTQFKRVEVVEGAGGNGKTVHEFTDDSDYALWAPTNAALSSKQRFGPWAYGLPKKITYKDAAGIKVKEIEHQYQFVSYEAGRDHGVSKMECVKCFVKKSSSQRHTDWTTSNVNYTAASNADMLVDMYNIRVGRADLLTTIERSYKPNDESVFVTNQTDYTYDFWTNEVARIVTKNSNNDQTETIITFNGEQTAGVFGILKSNNVLNVPINTVKYSTKNGGTLKLLEESSNVFTQVGNGNIKLYQKLSRDLTKPVDLWPSPPAMTVKQTFSYDASGNLVLQKDDANRKIRKMYDYDDKFIVAEIVNADITDKVLYTSFENTNNYGGWTTGGPVYTSTLPIITGAKVFQLVQGQNYITANSLGLNRTYVLSFWASGSIGIVGNATLQKSGPTMNGFSYYEYDIAAGTNVVTLSSTSGSPYIDELRLYPKDARMQTTTYDPLIGQTSTCDANSRITFYEYDNLGRLQFIRDEKRNIVKAYEYNTVSNAKMNGCPVTYYNQLITEDFRKSNCGSGYIGGLVQYIIPANKYSSLISQQDADRKAEDELAAYGQSNADNSSSCIQVWVNQSVTITDTTENCAPGWIGGPVTYTVPAGRYSSTISQADANEQALDDAEANAQDYANSNPNCIYTTAPDWQWQDTTNNYYCQTINGQLPAHIFVMEKDMNPHSSTYNQIRWQDAGPSDLCPSNTYYNSQQSASFTRNDCGSGYNGSSVTYAVPPGKYSSTVSQAAADQLALNEINANGQTYANSNGQCTPSVVYAQLSFENWYYGYNQQYADVVIRYYSDAACTQPISVSGLDVNIMDVTDYYDYYQGWYTTNNPYTITAYGYETVLNYSTLMYEQTNWYEMYRYLYLQAGYGYYVQ